MKKVTLKALKQSIRHWERIAKGEEREAAREGCALCSRFCDELHSCEYNGERCPVANRTKRGCCQETPYSKWIEHHREKHSEWAPRYVKCDECKRLALKEAAFLRSLLPKEEP